MPPGIAQLRNSSHDPSTPSRYERHFPVGMTNQEKVEAGKGTAPGTGHYKIENGGISLHQAGDSKSRAKSSKLVGI